MTDIMIPIVRLSIEEKLRYSEDIHHSNLPDATKLALNDLMDMARKHTNAAISNGWLSREEVDGVFYF